MVVWLLLWVVLFLWYCIFAGRFFFFKQKTAYEVRISDWSSDVCSSDLFTRSVVVREPGRTAHQLVDTGYDWVFVKTGVGERISHTADRARMPSQAGTKNFRYYLSQAYVWSERYLIAAAFTPLTFRSEERRVGKECVGTCRSRGSR